MVKLSKNLPLIGIIVYFKALNSVGSEYTQLCVPYVINVITLAVMSISIRCLLGPIMRFIVLFLCLFSLTAQAAQSDVAFDPAAKVASVQLISSSNAVNGAKVLTLGLRVKLDDDWKTYWSSPGLAGAPPSIDWQGSENLTSVQWLWPTPSRMMVYDVETYGYKHEVIFPILVTVTDTTKPLELTAKATLLVCREVCIRTQMNVSFSLPALGNAVDLASSELIKPYMADIPVSLDGSSASVDLIGWDAASSQLVVELTGITESVVDGFVEGVDFTLFSQPEISQKADKVRLVMSAEDMAGTPARLDPGQQLQITLTFDKGGLVFSDTFTPTIVASSLPSWIYMLLLAVVGGFILNLMPCVLPVLSIKLLSVVESSQESTAQRRVNFLLSAAGIFVAFWLLAGLFIGLKAAGIGFGWGVQFQSPLFLLVMIPVLILFALNLLDKFDIQLPQFMMNRMANAKQGHFYQGIFAVLLATPCSAPFLGTAVAFALAGSSWQIMMIFTGLAFGLALPYLLIAAWPKMINVMPKPGMWMVRFRQALAVMLLLTLIWLIWLLQVHVSAVLWLIVIIVLISLVAALYFRPSSKTSILVLVGYLALSHVVFWYPQIFAGDTLNANEQVNRNTESGIHWQSFAPEKIPQYVAEGKTVFLDITADWCITCVVNERGVLARTDITELLNADHVIAMRGDWTQPDGDVEAYLKRYGRYAIPFNQVFGPALPRGKLLPELLTKDTVKSALLQAGK